MSIREAEKHKTNQRLRESLQRLIDGNPTDMELRRRANLKVSARTVQQEAGVSIGAIRHHPDVAKLIEDYKNSGKSKPDETPDAAAVGVPNNDLLKLQLEVNKLKNKVKRQAENLKKEKLLKEEYRAQADGFKAQNEEILSDEHQLMQALFSKVPLPERAELFRKKSGLNVVQFSNRDDESA